jgi:hypothetical protein
MSKKANFFRNRLPIPSFLLDFTTIASDFTFTRASSATIVNKDGLVETVTGLSDELVTNGDFTISSGWHGLNADRVISDGKLNINQISGFGVIYQAKTLTVGTFYKCTVEVSNYIDGGFAIGLAGSDISNYSPDISSSGTHTFEVQRVSGGTNNVGIILNGIANFSIDNISVKEVIEENVPRIDFSNSTFDVPILGSELITNGDFDTDSDWSKVNSTISGGTGNLDSTSAQSLLYQNILTDTKTYEVSFTVSNYNGVGQTVFMNDNGYVIQDISTNGYYEVTFTHITTSGNLIFRARYGGIYSIDNVSVKEVTAYATDDNGVFLLEQASTNLYLNSETLATQDLITSADIYTVSFRGTGTITFSGTYTGSLVGTGSNDLVELTFTATAGTLTSTVTGTVSYGQCEALDYATSYIPTSVSVAKRATETCTKTNLSTDGYFGGKKGTILLHTDGMSVAGTSLNTFTPFRLYRQSGIYYRFYYNTDAAFLGGLINSETLGEVKMAISVSDTEIKIYVNGVEHGTHTIVNPLPSDLENWTWNAETKYKENVKDFRIYTEVLTHSQLTELTTI